eukprot:gene5107-biopygen3839
MPLVNASSTVQPAVGIRLRSFGVAHAWCFSRSWNAFSLALPGLTRSHFLKHWPDDEKAKAFLLRVKAKGVARHWYSTPTFKPLTLPGVRGAPCSNLE